MDKAVAIRAYHTSHIIFLVFALNRIISKDNQLTDKIPVVIKKVYVRICLKIIVSLIEIYVAHAKHFHSYRICSKYCVC